jgi:putative hemolysin
MARQAGSRYGVRFARTAADLKAAQRLRGLTFRGDADAPDGDALDARCGHVLVERLEDGALVACFRLLPLASGAEIAGSYAARHYDLRGLAGHAGPLLEMGRFCIHPDCRDPDVLRLAWAGLGAVVSAQGTQLMFGCTSFKGTDSAPYTDAFAMLAAGHLAPRRWLPRVKASSVFRFARVLRGTRPDRAAALRAMPPLLRSYLSLGGWVSDHAVLDRDLDTLHVFTGLDIASIPPVRARALRTMGAELLDGLSVPTLSAPA